MSYWEQHGGLAQFGYPLTEEFIEVSPTDGRSYTTQYFERARFEYHPENAPPYDVLLGLLGRTITAGRGKRSTVPAHAGASGAGHLLLRCDKSQFIGPVCGVLQEHGGLPVYGYPISEAFDEVSPTDGRDLPGAVL